MDTKQIVELTKYENKLSFRNKLGRFIWNIAYWFLFRPFSAKIFKGWRNFVLKCFGAKIKGSVLVYASAKIWAPWNLELDTACIAENTVIYSVDKIKLEKSAVVSQYAYLCTASHDVSKSSRPLITAPIIIKEKAWIAADAFIGMGVTVGEGAVVGARSAVFKDVAPWTIVGGNPAKFIKKRVLND